MIRCGRLIRTFLSALALAALTGFAAEAQDTRSQENRKARLQKEIKQINQQLQENKSRQGNEMSRVTLLGKKISARTGLIAENEAEIRSLSDSISSTTGAIKTLGARLDTLQLYYRRMIRTAYKNRDGKVWYLYILGSKDLFQGIRRAIYLRNIAREINAQAGKIRQTRQALEDEKDHLEKLSASAREKKAENEAEMATLRKEKSQSEETLNRLKKDKKKYLAQLEKKNKEIAALNKEIAAIIRKASEQAAAKAAAAKAAASKTSPSDKQPAGKTTPATGKTVSTDIDPALSGQFAANKGRLPWPAEGTVLERFGVHEHPVYKNITLPKNNGVTLSTRAGAPVKAVFDGEVTQVVVMPGFNQCVLVRHGKYFTFYCGLTGTKVKQGDRVRTGQTLGTVCTIDGEAKMHFELWQDRTPQNPENWLR